MDRSQIQPDDGAAERTTLAWERTSVAELALAAVMVRAGIVTGELAIAIAIAALLVLGAGAQWRFAVRAYRRLGQTAVGEGKHELALAGLAALVAISALASFVLVLES